MAASFDRTDVIRYLCDNTVLDWRHTVALADAFCETAAHRLSTRGIARYTTQTQRELEARCIALARDGRSGARACSAAAIALAVNNDDGLAAGQRQAARALAASDDLVTILVGPAGTGKTRLAAALRAAAEHDGMTIGGAALARRAARNLQDASGIPSTSVDAWCRRIATRGPSCLPDILVVDEANMVDTRALVTLATAAQRAGTRMIAMGDPQQLGAVGAGGGFLAWCRHLPIVELADVRRHTNRQQVAALRLWRDGHTERALDAFEDLGWIARHGNRNDAVAACVTGWDHDRHRGSTIMLAVTQSDVADLNDRARDLRRQLGELRGVDHGYGARSFAIGDRVRARRNTATLDNGDTGTITAVRPDRRVEIALDNRVASTNVVLEPEYAERYLEHAYAATITLTEGLTYDYAHALAGDALAKEAAYVALTRNRVECRLHDWLDHDHDAPVAISTERQSLSDRLQRARSEHLAIDDDPVTLERRATNLQERVNIWRNALAVLDPQEPIPEQWRAPLAHLRRELTAPHIVLGRGGRDLIAYLSARLNHAPLENARDGTMRRLLEHAREQVSNTPMSRDAIRSRVTLDEALALSREELVQQHRAPLVGAQAHALETPTVDHGMELGL
jgi:hypothetical protein